MPSQPAPSPPGTHHEAPRGRRSGLVRIAGNLLLALAACGITYAGIEGILRVAAHRILPGGEWLTTSPVFRPSDDPVGYSLLPGASRLLCTGGAYTVRDRINSLGLRDVERTYGNPEGAGRILLLGDSFTYGQGVEMQDDFARRMERALGGVEVINAGVPGYALDQEYLLYKDRAYRFGAGLVILVFFMNDLEPPTSMNVFRDKDGVPIRYQRRAEVLAKRAAEAPTGLRGAVSSWLRNHSLLYSLVRNRLDNLRYRMKHPGASAAPRPGVPGYLDVYLDDPDAPAAEKWERGYKTLDALRALVEEKGSRLAVVAVPASWQLSKDRFDAWTKGFGADPSRYSRDKPERMLAAWCSRTGTPFLPLLNAFDGMQRSELYFDYDLHLNVEGHALAAEAIETFIREEKIVPPVRIDTKAQRTAAGIPG